MIVSTIRVNTLKKQVIHGVLAKVHLSHWALPLRVPAISPFLECIFTRFLLSNHQNPHIDLLTFGERLLQKERPNLLEKSLPQTKTNAAFLEGLSRLESLKNLKVVYLLSSCLRSMCRGQMELGKRQCIFMNVIMWLWFYSKWSFAAWANKHVFWHLVCSWCSQNLSLGLLKNQQKELDLNRQEKQYTITVLQRNIAHLSQMSRFSLRTSFSLSTE